jgi:hypothetical protein
MFGIQITAVLNSKNVLEGNACLDTNEYGRIFRIETDPVFQSMAWHCVKVETALGRLKLNYGRFQRLRAEIIREQNNQRSIVKKKKELRIIQKEVINSTKGLQRSVRDTLKKRSYLGEWCAACIADRKKGKRA